MRILIIVDCYLPSTKSSAKLVHDLALELRDEGHDVTVLTVDDRLARKVESTLEDGIQVTRVKTGTIKGASRVMRAVREAMLSQVLWNNTAELRRNRHDAIVFYSPSIFFGMLVHRLKRAWRCNAYLILRDIFPRWAVDAGILRRGPIYSFFRAAELLQYSAADIIGVQSAANLAYFARSPVRPRALEVLYNWATPAPRPAPRARTGEKVLFFFGGNMGVAQDMDAILRLAEAMRSDRRVHFLLVGDGSEVPRLARRIRERSLANVELRPPLPQHEYRMLLDTADIGLITLNARLTTQNVPGKLLGYLDAGLPILASLNEGNDLSDVLRQSGAGLGVAAGDDEALLAAARRLVADAALRSHMGSNGRSLLCEKMSTRAAAQQILRHFGAPARHEAAQSWRAFGR